MEPLGRALLAYFQGDLDAELVIHRDDGVDEPMPVGHFFRDPPQFSEIEIEALNLCSGRILDVGAGTGLHSLVLQQKGLEVTAIDIVPQAVAIMRQRGVKHVYCADVFDFHSGPFDTILLMGHGIGMVESLDGLDRFLVCARELAVEHGQIVLDSTDVRCTDDARHLAYHEANRRSGRYTGEIRLQVAYQGQRGPICGWLHVDVLTLEERAKRAGWTCEPIVQGESGQYLARLVRV
jgi:SAM-dependent methyltransferase